MDRKNFLEIKEEHFQSCEQIILQGGSCKNIPCNICPFDIENSTCDACCSNVYGNGKISAGFKDPKLKEIDKEIIKTLDEVKNGYENCS